MIMEKLSFENCYDLVSETGVYVSSYYNTSSMCYMFEVIFVPCVLIKKLADYNNVFIDTYYDHTHICFYNK